MIVGVYLVGLKNVISFTWIVEKGNKSDFKEMSDFPFDLAIAFPFSLISTTSGFELVQLDCKLFDYS